MRSGTLLLGSCWCESCVGSPPRGLTPNDNIFAYWVSFLLLLLLLPFSWPQQNMFAAGYERLHERQPNNSEQGSEELYSNSGTLQHTALLPLLCVVLSELCKCVKKRRKQTKKNSLPGLSYYFWDALPHTSCRDLCGYKWSRASLRAPNVI